MARPRPVGAEPLCAGLAPKAARVCADLLASFLAKLVMRQPPIRDHSDNNRPMSQAWRTTIFLMLAGAFNYADRVALTAVLPALRAEMKLSDADLGLVNSLFLWSYALGSPIAGIIGDRFPRRRLVVASLAAWSIVTLLMGTSRTFTDLAILRVALGIAECIYIPSATALLMEEHGSATRGRAISLAAVGISMGSLGGATLCGVLAEHHTWRSGFVVLGLAGVLLATFARTFLGVEPARPRGEIRGKQDSIAAPFVYLAQTPTYYFLLVAVGLSSFAAWILMAWLPLYFGERFAMGMGAAGFHGTFVISAFSMAGVTCGGWLSDRVAKANEKWRTLLLACSYMLAAPCLLAFVAGLPFGALYSFVALYWFLRSLGGANETPVMCDVVPSFYRASAQAVLNTFSLSAAGLGVLMAGILKARLGLEAIFAGVSAVFALAGLTYLVAYFSTLPRDRIRAKCLR